MIKLKRLFVEQPNQKPSDIKLMDIIEDVVELEKRVIDLKKRLKELVPQVGEKSRKIDPNFFKKSNNGEYLRSDDDNDIPKDKE